MADMNSNAARGNGLKVFLSVFIACAFFTNFYMTTNDASRFSLTVALAERGSLEITDILPEVTSDGWKMRDYAIVKRDDGRVVVLSDKAPLGSFVAVPAYAAARAAGLPMPWRMFIVSLMVSGLCAALTSLLIYRSAPASWAGEGGRVALALLYGIGSPALFYGSIFFSSSLTAFCLYASFASMTGLKRGGGAGAAALGGLLAGAAAASDYYAAAPAACLVVYGASFGRRAAFPAVAGFAVPIAALLLYHDAAFGAPWPLSYKYAALFGQYHSSGFFGVSAPGPEGLKRLAVLLFGINRDGWGFVITFPPAILAAVAFRRYAKSDPRAGAAFAAMAAALLFINTGVGWFDAYSARFMTPLLPFLVVALTGLDMKRPAERAAFAAASAVSLAVNVVGADRFMPERIWEAAAGAQNLAAAALAPFGVSLGYGNFAFLALSIALVWLPGAVALRRQRKDGKEGG